MVWMIIIQQQQEPVLACRPDSAVIDCNGNKKYFLSENQTRKEKAIQEINWAEWSPFEYSKCTEGCVVPMLYDNLLSLFA